MSDVVRYDLPACYRLTEGRCRVCGKAVVQVDDIEGLPVYRCPSSCDQRSAAGGQRCHCHAGGAACQCPVHGTYDS